MTRERVRMSRLTWESAGAVLAAFVRQSASRPCASTALLFDAHGLSAQLVAPPLHEVGPDAVGVLVGDLVDLVGADRLVVAWQPPDGGSLHLLRGERRRADTTWSVTTADLGQGQEARLPSGTRSATTGRHMSSVEVGSGFVARLCGVLDPRAAPADRSVVVPGPPYRVSIRPDVLATLTGVDPPATLTRVDPFTPGALRSGADTST